jgi:hypothetical protein
VYSLCITISNVPDYVMPYYSILPCAMTCSAPNDEIQSIPQLFTWWMDVEDSYFSMDTSDSVAAVVLDLAREVKHSDSVEERV